MPTASFIHPGTFTWTVPTDVFSATVQQYAAGGGGGSVSTGGFSGAGGGGGAYTIFTFPTTPGDVYAVVVGAGGGPDADGGDSYLQLAGVDVSRASGGKGAAGGTTGGRGGSLAATYAGGNGGNGVGSGFVSRTGGGGGGGGATQTGPGTDGGTAAGVPPALFTGGAGGTDGGGDGGTYPSIFAGSGSLVAGGGGGASSSGVGPGGSGADGLLFVSYSPNPTHNQIGHASIRGLTTRNQVGHARITDVPQAGYNIIRMAVAPPTGKSLQITYYRLGADIIAVEDTALVALRAAIEGGSGKSQQIISDSANSNYAAGLQSAQKALAAFKELAITRSFKTFRAGLRPGMALPIGLAAAQKWNLPAYFNGVWLVNQVAAQYIPGMPDSWSGEGLTWDEASMFWGDAGFSWDALTGPKRGPVLYTVTVINAPQVATDLNFWERLT